MKLRAPLDLSDVKPLNHYRVDGRKGIRIIRATSPTSAAREYLGHNYLWWVEWSDYGLCDIYESDTDGSRLYVESLTA